MKHMITSSHELPTTVALLKLLLSFLTMEVSKTHQAFSHTSTLLFLLYGGSYSFHSSVSRRFFGPFVSVMYVQAVLELLWVDSPEMLAFSSFQKLLIRHD